MQWTPAWPMASATTRHVCGALLIFFSATVAHATPGDFFQLLQPVADVGAHAAFGVHATHNHSLPVLLSTAERAAVERATTQRDLYLLTFFALPLAIAVVCLLLFVILCCCRCCCGLCVPQKEPVPRWKVAVPSLLFLFGFMVALFGALLSELVAEPRRLHQDLQVSCPTPPGAS